MLRRSLELGLGALLVTKEAADELIEDLTTDGGVDRQKAKEMVEELVERAKKMREELVGSVKKEVEEASRRSGLATRQEITTLSGRVAALEQRLAKLELGAAGIEAAADL